MGYTPQKPNQNKKCPFFYAFPNNENDDCIKERCSFWIEIQKCCSIKLIATSLGNIEHRERIKRHTQTSENLIEEI